ncbi:NmrA-like family domain-containing protein 1 [Ceratobasidium sp. AG-Ba]|nr:NmrA-like family domain-containing protein 1 [Ceratobasidium sp. AG-Ba]
MTTKVIAIAGATGFLGGRVTNALLDAQVFDIRILARSSSTNSEKLQTFKARGATLHSVSYDDETSLVGALKGVDVLLSTVGGNALLSAQIPLIRAAKAAGVATFLPSEFGGRFENIESSSPLIQAKQQVVQAAKDAGLPFTVLATGPFPEACLIPLFGYDFTNKKITIWGNPDVKITFTTTGSIADWLAHVLKHVPISQLQNRYLNIQGDFASANDIIKHWERKHQAKLDVEHRSLEEVEQRMKNPNDVIALFLTAWYSGQVQLKPLDNDLYPDWKPASVESVL